MRVALGICLPLALMLVLGSAAADRPGTSRRGGASNRPGAKSSAETNTVETATAATRSSIVVITQFGRNGREEGVGAGFVISEEGLIATSLHVIGEARAVRVRLADGRTVPVTEVTASDRKLDLAILRVDSGRLKPLRLGDSDQLAQGAPVIAIGNPMGLEHSVVQGVLSARREFDGVEMLQVAIPIEPGNSGGPLVDLRGRVQGVITLKSAMTRNLGFAMPVNALKKLLDHPNPVPMSRWLTIGVVNPREWTTRFGANWSQRAGRITVDGLGRSFGGRALLLSRLTPPERPFEIAVEVKLDDESGAAGLIFGADGEDRHFGFYPSAGQLRLTRFEGPDVYSWSILRQVPSAHYRRGDWNHLRVRVETNILRCFVNGAPVCEVEAGDFAGARVGLAKFRETRAEFRGFELGTQTAVSAVPGSPGRTNSAALARILQAVATASDRGMDGASGLSLEALLADLRSSAPNAERELAGRAADLERQATQLRRLATRLHRDDVRVRLVEALDRPEPEIDLFQAALLVAKHDAPELEVEAYRRQLREMAAEIARGLTAQTDHAARLQALRTYLFTENGFHGSRIDYYNRANSYVNQVLDDREGLPITLSIVFLELARSIGLTNVSGAPLPGHFMVRYDPPGEPLQLIDVFDGGKLISRGDAQERVQEATGEGFREEHLAPAAKRDIIVRMLRNLQSIAEREGHVSDALAYADLLVALARDPSERLTRLRLRLQRGETVGAREDVEWLLKAQPGGVDVERLKELLDSLPSAAAPADR